MISPPVSVFDVEGRSSGRRWQPLYLRTDDGSVIAQPWAAGFMFAVKRWPAAWRPMFERGDHVAQAYHQIPEAVRAIRAYWRQHKP